MKQLKELITEQTHGDINHPIRYAHIARQLQRPAKECYQQWRKMKIHSFKHSPYTQEEENLIARRIQEWGDRGHGLWRRLEKELNRSRDALRLKVKRAKGKSWLQ